MISDRIRAAVERLGPGALSEESLQQHVRPLFSRTLRRSEIYLANHSLGRPLDLMADDVAEALNAWYGEMDGAWETWLKEQSTFRNNIASLIGMRRADAVVPKVSAGQGLRAVLNALPQVRPRVVATRGEFDSIDFILKTYALRGRIEVHWVDARPEEAAPPRLETADILDAIERFRPDLVIVSHIYYATGQVLCGLDRVVDATHRQGGLILLDAFHSAGVLPLNLEDAGIDFAIGGSYKYTRGGPGAAWLALSGRTLQNPSLRTLDTGWFAKRDTFRFERPEEPLLAAGGDAWLEATPAPLPLFQARSGLQLVLAMGVERLRKYSLDQLAQLTSLLESRGVAVRRGGTTPETSGAFLLVPHNDAPGACDALKREGVNVDARLGHLRLCPDVVTSSGEMRRASEIIGRVLRGRPASAGA
ncbi:MAG: aminotransferase class V-fold PLP-dependent enzyme [Planctomycetes bacterium]|nr:aminotransferase class V-fold PLP-dependent enzyme [Planctomycetota bacterium]